MADLRVGVRVGYDRVRLGRTSASSYLACNCEDRIEAERRPVP